MTNVESRAMQSLFRLMKIEFRLITAAVIAAILISQPLSRVRVPLRWMKMLLSRCSSARLGATMSMKSESHWIASRTAPRRQPTLTFSSLSAKSTTPNAAAIAE
jgi:hypothetical protein